MTAINDPINTNLIMKPTETPPPVAGWRSWRIIRVGHLLLAWLKQRFATVGIRGNTETIAEVRAARKERNKRIRRQMRGLAPTIEPPEKHADQ